MRLRRAGAACWPRLRSSCRRHTAPWACRYSSTAIWREAAGRTGQGGSTRSRQSSSLAASVPGGSRRAALESRAWASSALVSWSAARRRARGQTAARPWCRQCRRTPVLRRPRGSTCPRILPGVSPCRRARSWARASKSGASSGAGSRGQHRSLQTTPGGRSICALVSSSTAARRAPRPRGAATRRPGFQNSTGNSVGRL